MSLTKTSIVALFAGLAMTASSVALAQTSQPDPGHPRVNEVERRIENQQNRVDKGVSSGQINANQAARDDAKLAREQSSLNKDMAGDKGHITKAEQKNLNKRLNKGSRTIHRQDVAKTRPSSR